MLQKALCILMLGAVLLTTPASSLTPSPTAQVAAVDTLVYLPFIARPAPPQALDLTFQFSQTVQPQGDTRQLAVAFHSVEYIDAHARTLGELIFGTPEANALQGEGWFGNEVWHHAEDVQPVGTFQWAGGAQRRATLHLTLPSNAEGLLFDITSIVDGMWMDVTVDGQFAASLRVDAYWHSGYVPVGEAVPEARPANEPQWVEDQYFPHFPPTDRLYVFTVPTELEGFEVTFPSWRINQSYRTMMTLTIVGMQGIINRNRPRVYLDYQNNLNDASRFWVPYLQEHVEVVDLDLDYLSIIQFLLRRYAARFAGAVVYDPDIPETINLATMIAGLEDRMILAPEQLALPGLPEFESITDLRQLVREQGWDNSAEGKCRIYDWVYDHLWSRLEYRILGVISPGPPASFEYRPGHYNPLCLAQRDYFIALRLTALFLDPGDPQQAAVYGKFLEDAPSPIPVTGVSPREDTSVPFISKYGDWMACLSYPQFSLSAFNLTVFSGVRPETHRYQPEINADRILATLGGQPVAMMFSSDGDNLALQMDRGFPGAPDWLWEKVQGSRFGWTINPTLANLAPVIWNFYVDTRDEVELVCGLSGAGATLIDHMSESQFRAYLEKTALYLNQTGLRTIHVHLDLVRRWTHEMAQGYHEELAGTGFLGVVAGPIVPWGLDLAYAGVASPAPHVAYHLEWNNPSDIVDDLVSRSNEEIVFGFGAYPDHRGTVIQDPAAENGQAALFSSDSTEYVEVTTGPLINLAPGEYTATFRFKASNNQSTQNFVDIAIGHTEFVGVSAHAYRWHELARRAIAPHDFQGPNQYQLIEVPFRLDRLTTYVEVIIRHKGAYADLTADYYALTKDDPDAFPVFAVLFIPTVTPQRITDLPRQFSAEFESAGGILLTPDEFMAALNPEYMLEFALPYLGAEHPALAQAQRQMQDGYYMKSLITVRKALQAVVE